MQKMLLSGLIFLLTSASSALSQETTCPDLSALQVAAGYVTLLNTIKIFGAALVVLGALFIFGGLIVKVVYNARVLLEGLGYFVSVGLIASGYWLPDPAYLTWIVFTGCILFAGTVFATIKIHNIEGNDPKGLATLFMLVWGAVAIFYNMTEVAFLSVLALMTILGFMVVVDNLSYVFGFEKEKYVPNATLSALILLTAFLAIHVMTPDAPAAVEVFKPGVFWVSSFVGFTGLLIMSSRIYSSFARGSSSYLVMQLATIVTYFVAMGAALVLGINPLAGMAGTFLVLYIAEKIADVPTEDKITFGVKLMLMGGLLYGAWWYGTEYTTLATEYLTTKL